MHDSDSGIDSQISPIFAGIGIGTGIAIRDFMKTPACRTSRESMGYKISQTTFTLTL